jgi:predicted N-acyltransferase
VDDETRLGARQHAAIDEVNPASWNALSGTDSPFLRHEFLSALERHRCVGTASGWTPCHLTLRDTQGALLAALPLYRKMHSWGEFVFDFAWAQAYARTGLQYYPKLVSAVPFTPAGGPRFLVHPDCDGPRLRRALLDRALELARDESLSSLHFLFVEQGQADELRDAGLLQRRDCQFHWHNRGYADFDAYLETFTAEKRKKARRERRRVRDAGIAFRTLHGDEMDARLWRIVYAFHADTFLRHGHTPYLNLEFFRDISRRLPRNVVIQLAMRGRDPVAAAICFRSADTLYGRYWGASEDHHSLHFETCYHQGIEYCIREGLRHFEPGTQGEHKVSRGFEPTLTWSAHWIADERFARAIDDYLLREGHAVSGYAAEIETHVPYKKSRPRRGQ